MACCFAFEFLSDKHQIWALTHDAYVKAVLPSLQVITPLNLPTHTPARTHHYPGTHNSTPGLSSSGRLAIVNPTTSNIRMFRHYCTNVLPPQLRPSQITSLRPVLPAARARFPSSCKCINYSPLSSLTRVPHARKEVAAADESAALQVIAKWPSKLSGAPINPATSAVEACDIPWLLGRHKALCAGLGASDMAQFFPVHSECFILLGVL
jgi:hypothetical protein